MHKRAKDLIRKLGLQPHPEEEISGRFSDPRLTCNHWMRDQLVAR
jgi:hypothetical protein